MNKVIAFIDGFNLYHSLVAAGLHDLKWINYWNLADAFVKKQKEQLIKVFYFSALANWDKEKADRHRNYIRALESANVEVILGKFKRVTKTCRADCRKEYKTFEEKETDINIAVTMLLEAANNTFDKALLFSADSDMIAGIRALKKMAPDKDIQVVIPYGRNSEDLEQCCHYVSRVNLRHLKRNQFPPIITLKNGSTIEKPASWTLAGDEKK